MLITSLTKQSKAMKLPLTSSMYLFDDIITTVYENTPIADVKPFDNYKPYGMTALFDGVLKAIQRLEEFGKPTKDSAFLVMVVTDGDENASHYKTEAIAKMQELQATGKWTFTFQVPKGAKASFVNRFNIPEGNVSEWEQTAEDTKEVAKDLDVGTQSYMDVRSKGGTATLGFFTTDASKVTATKLKRNLDEVTSGFRSLKVEKEQPIRDFVQEKTKKVYVIGSAYYQLMKEEKIQPQKDILIQKKDDKKIYGGDNARTMIGLPVGEHAKVAPGNHSNFDIFVKSTSVNRKLVRGTTLLLDKSKVTNDTPTWDHNAAGV